MQNGNTKQFDDCLNNSFDYPFSIRGVCCCAVRKKIRKCWSTKDARTHSTLKVLHNLANSSNPFSSATYTASKYTTRKFQVSTQVFVCFVCPQEHRICCGWRRSSLECCRRLTHSHAMHNQKKVIGPLCAPCTRAMNEIRAYINNVMHVIWSLAATFAPSHHCRAAGCSPPHAHFYFPLTSHISFQVPLGLVRLHSSRQLSSILSAERLLLTTVVVVVSVSINRLGLRSSRR